jgi:hypothetical protein
MEWKERIIRSMPGIEKIIVFKCKPPGKFLKIVTFAK